MGITTIIEFGKSLYKDVFKAYHGFKLPLLWMNSLQDGLFAEAVEAIFLELRRIQSWSTYWNSCTREYANK